MQESKSMDLITELENEFSALSEQGSPGSTVVRTESFELELRLPQLGDDYVAGLCLGALVIIPKRNIIELRSAVLPLRKELTLEQFLSSRRTPVRIQINTGRSLEHCWLLNVLEGWLRVGISTGISWVPIEAILSLEILAVDNSIQ
jgi:hypothetical protein